MVDFLQEYWWVFLILWLVTKVGRHLETKKKETRESNTSDAENLVLNTMRAIDANIKDRDTRDKVLNASVTGLGDNVYKRALVDGIIHQLEKDDIKKFEPIRGSHPLSHLAHRAVESETKREKIKRGCKKAAVIGLKILRGGLT